MGRAGTHHLPRLITLPGRWHLDGHPLKKLPLPFPSTHPPIRAAVETTTSRTISTVFCSFLYPSLKKNPRKTMIAWVAALMEQESRVTCAFNASILSVIAVMASPGPGPAQSKGSLRPSTGHFVQPDGP